LRKYVKKPAKSLSARSVASGEQANYKKMWKRRLPVWKMEGKMSAGGRVPKKKARRASCLQAASGIPFPEGVNGS
jgi:hypothetical protein